MDRILKSRKIDQTSLGRCMLIFMTGLLVSIGTLFWWGAYSQLATSFDAFDVSYYENELKRVAGVLKQNQLSFELQIKDYAHWDDTEAFVSGDYPVYIEENFTPISLANNKISGYLIARLDGSFAAPPMILSDDALIPMPAKMRSVLSPLLPALMTADKPTANTALFWLNDQATFVSGVTITDSNESRPPSGYLLFFRHFDSAILDGFRSLTSVDFTLLPQLENNKANFKVQYLSDLDEPAWVVSKNLKNLPAMIEIQGTTHLKKERYMSFVLLGSSVAGLTLFSLLGIYLCLHFRILKRLHIFSQLADKHRLSPQQPVRWPIKNNDELDNLAFALNELMSEVEVRHKEMSFLADHDPLTGLGNRRLLMAQLDANINRQKRHPTFISTLLLIDLDEFKLLNDGLGHNAGDDILKLMSLRMLSQVRNYDTVVRLGGDEFAILLDGVGLEMAQSFAERLLDTITQPFKQNGQDLILRASIGLTAVNNGLCKENLIRYADLAMYEAKRRGKGQVTIFKMALLDTVSRRVLLEQALHSALNDDQLEVWFQPIVDLNSGEVVNMEALSRWSLAGEFVPPEEFINIAEITGMIIPLGQQLFDKVGCALQELRVEHPNLQCNINLSVKQFRDRNLFTEITSCLNKYQLPTSAFHLELTESMVVETETDILPMMQKLVEHGLKFHLDDFGTGYSSLDRLNNLPFDTLKIDRSFVTSLGMGDDIMARNIINIGNELGLNIIAEGVETQVELDRLMDLGCSQIQGYYFAKPMPLSELKDWLYDKQHQVIQMKSKRQA
ncbi:periplasmic sensor diguanylate cyclase/phosphodiesterase [Psychromonas ingrahamii 37]|uniref:Periplasmic sensor diguanylate cyclase/phosphodiesterase n=1 Tax=Psychromonas ingrahamii (strain DSM 17664 / CCUG 51855 / 37) TaxID=357804 RepID=A1SRH3_PSYIN|nr:EAL domain-containing protein [Psychromonas ingrahamii]ABM02088.1 periplasmic sensor diguanylate cyclase/phosphodiesterase [Psychromonas ingrahamii 37]